MIIDLLKDAPTLNVFHVHHPVQHRMNQVTAKPEYVRKLQSMQDCINQNGETFLQH